MSIIAEKVKLRLNPKSSLSLIVKQAQKRAIIEQHKTKIKDK